jgi:hypothetical protein
MTLSSGEGAEWSITLAKRSSLLQYDDEEVRWRERDSFCKEGR